MDSKDENKKIRVGISVGDLNGIGCEVALKCFLDSRMLDFCTPVFFASSKSISEQIKALGFEMRFQSVQEAEKALEGRINVVNVWKEPFPLTYGSATAEGGKYAIKSLKAAVGALKKNHINVLVTAPINKNNIQADDFTFPGHTDYLAHELEGESLMFMVTNDVRVGLLTDHIAVKNVSDTITTKLVREKVFTILNSLTMDFGIRKPKIALLGINPHSGDNGTIGKEDEEIMKPAITSLFNEGNMVYGPYSADGFFGSQTHLAFDAVLAAYHDQGLIPFKTLSFGQGVNYTAGLSKIRTSPDHGTAYEIAGKSQADESSFKEAIFTAITIFRNRRDYKNLTKNPLKKQSMKRTG
ncbi:MAG: 4-hydroxythreonine-4-phosphate dehydrogenase PdxA [Bacteroidota bacterium]